MKNVLLTSLFIVALSFGAFATNTNLNSETETKTEKKKKKKGEAVDYQATTSNYYNVIKSKNVNTFVKLIQLNDYNAVKNLINAGTNINQKTMGMTPLMYAARQNKTQIVELLIQNGARLKTKSQKGLTALDYAKMSGAQESYDFIKTALK